MEHSPIEYSIGVVFTDDGPLVLMNIRQGSFVFSGTLPTVDAARIGASLSATALEIESSSPEHPPTDPPIDPRLN